MFLKHESMLTGIGEQPMPVFCLSFFQNKKDIQALLQYNEYDQIPCKGRCLNVPKSF